MNSNTDEGPSGELGTPLLHSEATDDGSESLAPCLNGSTKRAMAAAPHPGFNDPGFKVGRLDANRIGNKIAVLGLVIFWVWFCTYLVLLYVPFGGYNAPGGPTYTYSSWWSEWADKVCPVDPSSGEAYNSYCLWYYPSFLAFTLAAIACRRLSIKPHKSWPGGPKGDTDMTLLFYVAVAAPMLVYWGLYIKKKYSPRGEDTPEGQQEYIIELMGNLANRSGFLGLWPLTFFMIPATKHAPVLALLNWHPFHAMTIHMWCGRLSFIGSFLHFFFYILKYFIRGVYNGYRPVQFFFPTRECFYVIRDEELPHECSKMLNGFFGTLAIFFFTVLIACSIKHVRRHRYMLFYYSHIICAPLFLVFLVMHYKAAHYYLWPSMFYYAAAQTPFIVQHWTNTINTYGLKVNKVVDIPCREALTEGGLPEPKKRSLLQRILFVETQDWLEEQIFKRGPTARTVEHCVSFDFECTAEAMEQYRPGVYANIFVPDINIKSHPFTVMHVPGKPNECRIVFRVFGGFTDLMARSLIRLVEPTFNQEFLPIPKLMADGWHGVDTLEEALNHDKVVLIAAGIGITAHMALFCELIVLMCFQKDGLFTKQTDIKGRGEPKEVTLHWMCRDENLIRFITDEYFGPLLVEASARHSSQEFTIENGPARCRIVIHRTGPLKSKDVHESSLWKSFIDKDIEGPTVVDYTSLGTYGVPWLPSRFAFGRHETFLGSLPAMLMFLTIFWFSYWFSFRVSIWISKNPWGYDGFMQNLSYAWICVPTLLVAFGGAYLGHMVMDWRDNIAFSKVNEQRRTLGAEEWDAKFEQLEEMLCENTNNTITALVDSAISEDEKSLYKWAADQHKNKTLELSKRMKLESLEVEWDDTIPISAKGSENYLSEQPASAELGSKYLTLTSRGGRPSGEDMFLDCEAHCEPGCEFDPISTGIFLCGPEAMIASVKKATGLKCMVAAEKCQNFATKNKFVFYEEKFEW